MHKQSEQNNKYALPLPLCFTCYLSILIIYFMSVSPRKLTERTASLSPERQAPSTPKKKPKYSDEETNHKPRVKSITKVVQKQATNFLYSFLVLVWALFLGGAVLMSYQAKIQSIDSNAVLQIEKCKLDYQNNRCDNPVKGAVQFCLQKEACMKEEAQKLAQRSVSYMGILGEIAREFLNGAGLFGVGVMVFLIWLSLRQQGVNRTITNVEYFDSQ